jgi:hypothetical protein
MLLVVTCSTIAIARGRAINYCDYCSTIAIVATHRMTSFSHISRTTLEFLPDPVATLL